MQLQGDGFDVVFERAQNAVVFNGVMRLENMQDYDRIGKFLLDVNELELPQLVLDFRKVEFLNSAGIAMLCRFIMDAKKLNKKPVSVIGNENVLWQKKSFSNLKLLWDKIDVRCY